MAGRESPQVAAGGSEHIQNRSLFSFVLLKDPCLDVCRVRHRLPPVILDELLSDVGLRQSKRFSSIVTVLD